MKDGFQDVDHERVVLWEASLGRLSGRVGWWVVRWWQLGGGCDYFGSQVSCCVVYDVMRGTLQGGHSHGMEGMLSAGVLGVGIRGDSGMVVGGFGGCPIGVMIGREGRWLDFELIELVMGRLTRSRVMEREGRESERLLREKEKRRKGKTMVTGRFQRKRTTRRTAVFRPCHDSVSTRTPRLSLSCD